VPAFLCGAGYEAWRLGIAQRLCIEIQGAISQMFLPNVHWVWAT